MAKKATKPDDCFVIMPISPCEGYEPSHFDKVYEDIFKVAIRNAGFSPIRADEVKQTNLIHLDILQKLIDSPMAICDLSTRNPNVLFELGLRQAFDKPTVLVQEEGTRPIFDIGPLRYTEYQKELRYRDVLEAQEAIRVAIAATKEATDKGEGINSIISLLSLSNPAALKEVNESDTGKILQIIRSDIADLKNQIPKKKAADTDGSLLANLLSNMHFNTPPSQNIRYKLKSNPEPGKIDWASFKETDEDKS